MTPDQIDQLPGGRETVTLTRYRWWYKGKTTEGNIARFEGHGWARCFASASRAIEAMMRRKYPTIQWMRGKETEGGNLTYGPTIQMLKTTKQVTTPTAPATEDASKASFPHS